MPITSPQVSVVICFLNGANFISDAIASVLRQSSSEWELVLVDDGSTDESTAIARTLANEDARVRYVAHREHDNQGLAISRALGAEFARGEYLLFLDHDDILYPGTLARLADLLDAHPQAAAVLAAARFCEWSSSGWGAKRIQTLAPLRNGMTKGRRFLRLLVLRDAIHPCICSILYRRKVLIDARELARELWPEFYEDTALLIALTAKHDVYILNEPVADYRIHPDSRSHILPRDFPDFLRWAMREISIDPLSRALIHLRRLTFELREGISNLKNGITGR